MVTVKDILAFLDSLAPMERKMEFDNVGLLVGWQENRVTKILTALDITSDVIDEAESIGAELIVSHHPVIFDAMKSVCADDICGSKILKLASAGISAICMHTNLDVSRGGVNDALAESLGLENVHCLTVDGFDASGDEYGLGRYGELSSETELSDFLQYVKRKLQANGLRYVNAGKKVRHVAVCGGSGGSELLKAAQAGCDTYVTADIKYNAFLDAEELGINLIDAGHFPTENVIITPLSEKLSERFPDVQVAVSSRLMQPERFF